MYKSDCEVLVIKWSLKKSTVIFFLLILLIIVTQTVLLLLISRLKRHSAELESSLMVTRFEMERTKKLSDELTSRLLDALGPWKGRSLTEDEQNKLSLYARTVQETLLSSQKELASLVNVKPTLGGSWGLYSSENIIFITQDLVFVTVEDGHMMVKLLLRIENSKDVSSWKVLARFTPDTEAIQEATKK